MCPGGSLSSGSPSSWSHRVRSSSAGRPFSFWRRRCLVFITLLGVMPMLWAICLFSQTQLDEETGVLFAVGKAAVGVCCQLLQEVGVVGHHEAHQHLVALTLHGGRAVKGVSLGVHLCHGAFCLVAVQLLFYA